uniref:Uncharacterized protein n=1 Tax=Ackermannviridae sp. TaxID=2831612 RepID=A0A8S5RTZ1_9CAUD|nr:MAG TPA: hypothetical protein [Ackermannviridae sp.]
MRDRPAGGLFFLEVGSQRGSGGREYPTPL